MLDIGFQGKEGQQVPELTEEKINDISNRYIELYEKITGEAFVKADITDVVNRIDTNVKGSLQSL